MLMAMFAAAMPGRAAKHTNFDPLIGLNNAFGDMLLNFVMAMMFIVLPTFWVMALAWGTSRNLPPPCSP